MDLETIKRRKSVRTYDGNGLDERQLSQLEEIIGSIDDPFAADVRFVILDGKKQQLGSPVLVGERYYVCAITRRDDPLALGYVFEDLVMRLQEVGLDTVIIAGTYNKESFLKALTLSEGEELSLITPVGKKAQKPSFREAMMRKGIKADERLPFEALFFRDDFDHPLDQESDLHEALEAVRWSPSAVNKQPTRVLVNADGAHFFKKTSRGYDGIQSIDVGIALRNFTYLCKKKGKILCRKPDVSTDLEYMISYIFE